MKLEKLVQLGSLIIIVAVAVVWMLRMGGEESVQEVVAKSSVTEAAPKSEPQGTAMRESSEPDAESATFVPPEEEFLTATRLTYTEAEPGITPYTTRVLVTKDFIRFDDGIDGGDYVLYDRRVRSVYSVVHSNRMILQILHREMLLPQPEDLEIEVERKALETAPPVADRTPIEIVYSANGDACQQAIVVPDLLPSVTAALREYEETMAGQSYSTLENTPPEMRSPCFMVSNLFIAGEYLKSGLPVQSTNYRGEQKLLTDYEDAVDLPSSMFDLNDEYFIMSLDQSI
jgi:hypothetical protein